MQLAGQISKKFNKSTVGKNVEELFLKSENLYKIPIIFLGRIKPWRKPAVVAKWFRARVKYFYPSHSTKGPKPGKRNPIDKALNQSLDISPKSRAHPRAT